MPWVVQDTLRSYPPDLWTTKPFSAAERKLLGDMLSESSQAQQQKAEAERRKYGILRASVFCCCVFFRSRTHPLP